jgi:hypothetical protein
MARNTLRGTPARVLILFALLTGAVAVFSIQDARKEGGFRVTYPTAVGDDGYYRTGGEPPRIAVHGAVYALREDPTERIQRRDDRMFRVPLAVSVPRLYTTSDSYSPKEVPPLYLKTADGEYLRVELERSEADERSAAEQEN